MGRWVLVVMFHVYFLCPALVITPITATLLLYFYLFRCSFFFLSALFHVLFSSKRPLFIILSFHFGLSFCTPVGSFLSLLPFVSSFNNAGPCIVIAFIYRFYLLGVAASPPSYSVAVRSPGVIVSFVSGLFSRFLGQIHLSYPSYWRRTMCV